MSTPTPHNSPASSPRSAGETPYPESTDAMFHSITEAVAVGRAGDPDAARSSLLQLWEEIGVLGDPLHRCTLAHYLADLYDDPAQGLVWDVRALDAAAATSDDRAQRLHGSLHIAGFYPSLHLNLADGYRRLASFAAAGDHVAAARRCIDVLADDPYGRMIRLAIDRVDAAITNGDTTAHISG